MPDAIDPSGFQISVVLRAGGNKFPLWVSGAVNTLGSIYNSDDQDALLYKDIPVVESVQIDVGIGLMGKISVSISAPYDLGLKLLSSSLFAIGVFLDVQIGYPRIGQFMPWFSGMTAKPDISINPLDGLTATLNVPGGALAAARSNSSRTFNGSYASIIQTIANDDFNKWELDLPDGTEGDDNDSLYKTREGVSQGNRTDWAFVQFLCRLANCDAFMIPSWPGQGNTNRASMLRVRRRRDMMGGTPRYTFVSRGQVDFINVFPLLSFESPSEGIWFPLGSREARAADVSMRNRDEPSPETVVRPEETDVPSTPGDTGVGAGSEEEEGTVAAVEGTPRDERGSSGRRVHAPAHAPESPQEVLTMMVSEGRQRGSLNVNISSIGLPHLLPGEVIAIDGVGPFDGNYAIESISHTAAPGDWTMNMKLLGDSLGGRAISEALQRPLESFNQESAPERQEAEGGGSTVVEPTPSEG